jgi:hypothetical protein
MTAPAHAVGRPSWLAEGAEFVGLARDVVSGQRYRLWSLAVPPKRRRFAGRSRREPSFFVEDVGSGAAVALLHSWEDSVVWHDRTVISTGWQTAGDGTLDGSSGESPGTDGDAHPIAGIRLLPMPSDEHAGHGGS